MRGFFITLAHPLHASLEKVKNNELRYGHTTNIDSGHKIPYACSYS